jgi:diguanylate cyclase (GGDEF)-like protein
MLVAQLTGFQFPSELDPEHQKRIALVALIFATMIAGALSYAFETQRWRIEQDRQAIYAESIRDPLTLTYNRRYFEQRMSEELAYAKRHRAPLSLLLLDVDHFKRINDAHGHPAGDAVLREIVARLQRTLRNEDILARYGGEEFVVALRGTAGEGARLAAERLRKVIEDVPIRIGDVSIACTISVGCAVLALDGIEPTSTRTLLDAADRRLYVSKESGRNRVTAQDG